MIKALIHLLIHAFIQQVFVGSYQVPGTLLDSRVTFGSESGTAAALKELTGLLGSANN